jgi:hypothetical protein
MNRLHFISLAAFVVAGVGAVGCGHAPPPPQPVLLQPPPEANPYGLRILISREYHYLGNGRDEELDAKHASALRGAQEALVTRMEQAGLKPVSSGPYDLVAGTSYAMGALRYVHPVFAKAQLRLKNRKGELIEEITLTFKDNEAPYNQPDRVAVSLVNQVVGSIKVQSFAAFTRSTSHKEDVNACSTALGD